ncbi:TonB-dependent receptor [bacterium]|nr:TonB-dependent receptor [bacterium]
MCLRFFVVIAMLLLLCSFAVAGEIAGKVVDSQTGEPLSCVNVLLKDRAMGDASDLDGLYIIKEVPEGEYTLYATRMGYSGVEITDINIVDGNTTRLDISISPEAILGEKITVTAKKVNSSAEALILGQKKAQAITSGISSEQMSKSGDSEASDALKRVTGLTVVNDKYVFVRGLSERYSNARLNQSALSSPEPDKRVVPFDIFPSNLLENVVVTKSFVPNLPGDFAGGCIQLTTKEFPEEFIGKFSVSTGMNSQTTFKDFQTYKGGGIDFLGFDDGTRALPDLIERVTEGEKIIEGGQFSDGFTADQIERFGEEFNNVWSPEYKKAPINQGYSLSLGNNLSLMHRPFGYIFSTTYKNDYSWREEERFYYINGAEGLEARHHYQDFTISKFHVLWGGILNTSYKISPLSKIGLKTTYTRTADDEVRTYGMYPNRDHNLDELCTRLMWVERSLFSSELSGEHQIKKFNTEFGWRGNYSLATRDEPDTREILYESDIGLNQFRLADESNSGSRFFSYLTDNNYDAGTYLKMSFKQWYSLPSKLEVGGNYTYKDREIDSRRFRFIPQDFNEVDIYQSPEEIFSPENIGEDGFQLEEGTRSTDNYSGTHSVSALYAMVDMPLTPMLRFVGGTRLENSLQEVKTYDLFNPDAEPIIGKVSANDMLPSINLTYSLNSNMNLRGGFSQTVSRPSFRELSSLEFTDIGGHAVVGNPELKRALIQNYDLRWEWYPGLGEQVTLALFYKHFQNPIEQTLLNATEMASSWQNAKRAYNYRFELETRKNLGFINPVFSVLTFTGNVAIIKSRVELNGDGMETTTERPLQGQSPYVINLMLEYSNPRFGTEISYVYNVFGRRISEVGIAGTPDIYEEPFNQIDMIIAQPILGSLTLKLAAKNLLNQEVEYTQGGQTQRHYKNGQSFSLGLSYSL